MTSSSSMTKYEQVCESLRDRIRRDWQPGTRIPSQSQLMKQFEASYATITRALSELRHEGLLVSHQGKGTFVAEPAMNTRASDVTTVGVSVHLANWPLMDSILAGVFEEASAAECRVLMSRQPTLDFAQEGSLLEHEAMAQARVEDLLKRGVQGLLLSSMDTRSPKIVQRIREAGVPVVFLTSVEDTSIDCVCIDDFAAGQVVTQHLLEQGYRRIVFAGHGAEGEAHYAQRRFNGYEQTMSEAGLEPRFWQIPMGPRSGAVPGGVEANRACFDELAQSNDAVITWSDAGAVALMSILHRLGYQVPDDLAMVGFNDSPLCSQPGINLTSLRQPTKRIGQEALQILLRKLSMPALATKPIRRVLPFDLIVRESTRPRSR